MGLAQTARDRQRATIGGRANPFQNDDPLGKAFADSIEKGAGDAVKGVMDWWERSSADQEGVSDDLLRLVAGGVKNTTKAWKAASAEQEGITDDILRGAAWTAGKGMQVLDAPGHYGGKGLSHVARMIGVDERIGGAVGYIGADLLTGAAITKAAKIGKATKALRTLDAVEAGGILKPGPGAARSFKSGNIFEDTITAFKAGGKTQKKLITANEELQKLVKLDLLDIANQQEEILKGVARAELPSSGKKSYLGRISPEDPKDLLPKIERYFQLQELQGKTGSAAKRGWEEIFGSVIGPDGVRMRVTGGLDGKPAKWQLQGRTAGQRANRSLTEGIWPTLERARPGKGLHKHHVNILETGKGWMYDAKGSIRPKEQIQALNDWMVKHGFTPGNQDLNEMYISEMAHLTGDFAVHKVVKSATDIQGPLKAEATAVEIIKNGRSSWLKVPKVRQKVKGKVKWIPGNPKLPKGATLGDRFKIGTRSYINNQRHGMSIEAQQVLSKITDTDELIETMELFQAFSGAGEFQQGAAALAHKLYDKGLKTDKVTKELANRFNPQMIQVVKDLLKLDQYKDNTQLLAILYQHQMSKKGTVQTARKSLSIRR